MGKKNTNPELVVAADIPLKPEQQAVQPIEPAMIQSVIGTEQVKIAQELLEEYKKGKANLEDRIVENEQWYKMRHWEQIRGKQGNTSTASDPEPASAWLFNSIANKHADAMDNFPEPNVLPREGSDKQDAEILSSILPVILERNEFEQTYSDAWWYKLKTGTAVYGVFWNNKLENGLGDIDIKQIDILNIFWEPGIKDIQKSPNVFVVNLVDTELLKQEYPQLANLAESGPAIDLTQYKYDDTVDTSKKSAVIDWYYKQTVEIDGINKDILHYCKFCNGVVLFATENPPLDGQQDFRLTGWYDHGMYPFEFDTLFVEEGTPCGFGYIDIMKDTQMYIDKLNQIVIKHAYDAQNNRFFSRDDVGINEGELLDPTKKVVHFTGQINDTNFRQFNINPIDGFIINHLNSKIDELKETSGNRDFSQGSTTSGVTAASAIAALQEAGSKLSRDMIKSSYRTFSRLNYLCIELIRQFYTEPRMFRVVLPNGQTDFMPYQNNNIAQQEQNVLGLGTMERKPIFDIRVTSQKSSPFSKVAQNELAKELYGAGFFNPQLTDQAAVALEMMDFEGKDMVMQKVTQNGTLMQLLQQLLPIAAMVDAQNGTNMTAVIAQKLGMPMPAQQNSSGVVDTNALGKAVQVSNANSSTKAHEKATNVASPK